MSTGKEKKADTMLIIIIIIIDKTDLLSHFLPQRILRD
jgi:hypothetical protein